MTEKTNDKQQEPKQSRSRGVILDAALVREFAAKAGIKQLHHFQSAYDKCNDIPVDGPSPTAPEKAWRGKPMDVKYAINIARTLGVEDYHQLECRGPSSKWTELLRNEDYKDSIFSWGFEEDDEWRNIDVSLLREAEELDPIDIRAKWQLHLFGKPGDKFAVFLQSDRVISQVAPREGNYCCSEIAPKLRQLAFPHRPLLQFSQEDGLGRRKLIVVRARRIPLSPRSDETGHLISQMELEHFAHQLELQNQKDIAVEEYRFELVEQDRVDAKS